MCFVAIRGEGCYHEDTRIRLQQVPQTDTLLMGTNISSSVYLHPFYRNENYMVRAIGCTPSLFCWLALSRFDAIIVDRADPLLSYYELYIQEAGGLIEYAQYQHKGVGGTSKTDVMVAGSKAVTMRITAVITESS